MYKLLFSLLLVFIHHLSFGQANIFDSSFKQTISNSRAFTKFHKSLSITYGISNIFNGAPYRMGSTSEPTNGSFAIGPISLLYNRGLTKDLSISFGPIIMYHKDKYKYTFDNPIYNREEATNLYFGGSTAGLNLHFLTGKTIDPYIGIATGIGYFWGRGGADQLGLRRKGEVALLYSGKLGMNCILKNNNALTFEAGYDYLSYLKIGYTLTKQK